MIEVKVKPDEPICEPAAEELLDTAIRLTATPAE